MPADPEEVKRHLGRLITQAVQNLDRELSEVIGRATAARASIEKGHVVGDGMFSILSHAPTQVERTGERLQALLEVGRATMTDEELNHAYTRKSPYQ